jgi:hypothetical protein
MWGWSIETIPISTFIDQMTATDIPNLDFLSPNECVRYIKEQLEETRKQRIKEARRVYSGFTKSRQQQFAAAKKVKERRQLQADHAARRLKLQPEIEELQRHLAAAREHLGSGQYRAVCDGITAEQDRESFAAVQAERDSVALARFRDALGDVWNNDPRVHLAERAQQLSDAKQRANETGDRRVARHMRQNRRRDAEALAQAERARAEDEARNRPTVFLDYSRTFFHRDIGMLPINDGAASFGSEREAAAGRSAEIGQKQRAEQMRHAKAAAHTAHVDHDTEDLQKELGHIRQLEVAAELTRLKEEPQKEHPAATTYCLDEREGRRQARIQRFLAANEAEGPKPRGAPPQPQPLNPIPTSPVISSDDGEEEDAT